MDNDMPSMAENCSYCHSKVEIAYKPYSDSVGRAYSKGLCPKCGRVNRRYKNVPVYDIPGKEGAMMVNEPKIAPLPNGHEGGGAGLPDELPDELPNSNEGGKANSHEEGSPGLPDELPNSNEGGRANSHEGANVHEEISSYQDGFIDGYEIATNSIPDNPSEESKEDTPKSEIEEESEEDTEDTPDESEGESEEESEEEKKGISPVYVLVAVMIFAVVISVFLVAVSRE